MYTCTDYYKEAANLSLDLLLGLNGVVRIIFQWCEAVSTVGGQKFAFKSGFSICSVIPITLQAIEEGQMRGLPLEFLSPSQIRSIHR